MIDAGVESEKEKGRGRAEKKGKAAKA